MSVPKQESFKRLWSVRVPPPVCLQDPPESWHLWRDVPRPRIRRRFDDEPVEDKEDKKAKKDKEDKNDDTAAVLTGASFLG